MGVKIITGKGGVGKTTAVSWIALNDSLSGVNVNVLSIDPMHSLADSFDVVMPYHDSPLIENGWVNIWSLNPWKQYKKTLVKAGERVGKLSVKQVVPTGRYLRAIKNPLLNDLYTEYELIAGKELLKFSGDELIIDTDSLEGLQRLLNYANEVPELSELLKREASIIPVTTMEPVVLSKLSRMLLEPLVIEYMPNGLSGLIINHVTSDSVLSSLPKQLLSNSVVFYEQPVEPVGIDLLKLTEKSDLRVNNELMINDSRSSLPYKTHKFFFVCGKGGQGKSTIASSIAVRLAELGKRVVLVSADARSSLSDVLAEPIGYAGESGLALLENTEQYDGLKIAVMRGNKYFDNIPGVPFMKALMRLNYQSGGETYLVIDAPPSGNIVKNFNNALPSDDFFNELIYKLDLWQLSKRGKSGVKQFLVDRREAFTKGLEVMRSPEVMAIPVMQPTKTALNETNNLISVLYSLGIYPYNPYELTGKPLVFNGLQYGYRKSLVINRFDKASSEFLEQLRETEFPPEMYDLAFIPSIDKPFGRQALSRIGRYLIG